MRQKKIPFWAAATQHWAVRNSHMHTCRNTFITCTNPIGSLVPGREQCDENVKWKLHILACACSSFNWNKTKAHNKIAKITWCYELWYWHRANSKRTHSLTLTHFVCGEKMNSDILTWVFASERALMALAAIELATAIANTAQCTCCLEIGSTASNSRKTAKMLSRRCDEPIEQLPNCVDCIRREMNLMV